MVKQLNKFLEFLVDVSPLLLVGLSAFARRPVVPSARYVASPRSTHIEGAS